MPMVPVRAGLDSLATLRAPALRRVRRATLRKQDVAVGRGDARRQRQADRRPVELDTHRAVEDVEVRPVRAKCVEPQVVFPEIFDDLVYFVLPVVYLCGEWPQILEHALDRPA